MSFDQLMVFKAVGFALGYAPAAVVGDQGGHQMMEELANSSSCMSQEQSNEGNKTPN